MPPLADVTEAEAAMLTSYVQGGGKLLVVTDFTINTPQLDTVMAACGMTRQAGLLVEDQCGTTIPTGIRRPI